MPLTDQQAQRIAVPVPLQARNTNSSAEFDVSGSTALRLVLNVTAASGTSPSLAVVVEDSLDGSTWTNVASFAAKTAAGVEAINVTTPFGPLVRLRWTITGTSPSFTFEVRAYAR